MTDESPLSPAIRDTLGGLRARQRRLDALRFALRGIFCGVLLACALAAAAAMSRDIGPGPWISLLAVPAAGLAGALAGLARPANDLRLARALDRAASSDDRFASALDLRGHPRRERVRLLSEDAIEKVRGVSPREALPFRAPPETKWMPLPALALGALLWLGTGLGAAAEPPEVPPERWTELAEDLRRQAREEAPAAQTPEEKEIAERMERLAELLAQAPDKKEALAEIARLRAELEKRRQGLKGRDVSARKAAKAVESSPLLKPFAQRLSEADFQKAAEELRKLAKELADKKKPLTAQDFESIGKDLDRLAEALAEHAELGPACRQCASAAGSLNREKLARALRELADLLDRNAPDLRKSERLCRACETLKGLERKLGESRLCRACRGKKGGG